ncbi:hypothetical protein SAMN06893096_106225 [Geodermatophilus pulveris]|uniref:HTH luxR-type domain-containing protein n=1 Tax=Geodermatophilus pulveris TaxID=1564159 RepID=A0A239GIC5_9ACTN|nr:hypothetical protein [Geodermatophilus pulveris]SNS69036.1 hypothetical protein SAMN06893096_106225 [Geodermatophilus pulveris]
MTDDVPPPLLVAPDEAAARVAAAALRDEGWTVTGPDAVPREPWDLRDRGHVVAMTVGDAALPDAVELAVRGAGLVVVVDVADPVSVEAFLDQLHRIGLVGEAGTATRPVPVRALTAEEAAVLDALADGASIPEAAARSFLSLRTANRRLASARAALGVASTRAAVLAHRAARDRR